MHERDRLKPDLAKSSTTSASRLVSYRDHPFTAEQSRRALLPIDMRTRSAPNINLHGSSISGRSRDIILLRASVTRSSQYHGIRRQPSFKPASSFHCKSPGSLSEHTTAASADTPNIDVKASTACILWVNNPRFRESTSDMYAPILVMKPGTWLA